MIDTTPLIRGASAVDLTRKCDTPAHVLNQAKGENVRLLQLEFDIFDDHPDVSGKIKRLFEPHPNDPCYSYQSLKHAIHATAVSSLIVDPNYGVAPDVNYYFSGVEKPVCCSEALSDQSLFESIGSVLRRLNHENSWLKDFRAGDIISISLQSRILRQGGGIDRLPIDADIFVRKQLNELYEKGFIVFVAAGNSRIDLDRYLVPVDEKPDSRRMIRYSRVAKSSHAIKVGYTGMGWANLNWSNFGSNVDFFAPTGSMRAACYNYDPKERRTDLIDTFSGGFGKTSASTPIIASIAARIQGAYRSYNDDQSLSQEDLISLMKTYSIPPNDNQVGVGVFPVLGKTIQHIFNGKN